MSLLFTSFHADSWQPIKKVAFLDIGIIEANWSHRSDSNGRDHKGAGLQNPCNRPGYATVALKMEWSTRFYPGFMLHRPNRAWFSLSLFGQDSTCVNSLRPTGTKLSKNHCHQMIGINNYTIYWSRIKW